MQDAAADAARTIDMMPCPSTRRRPSPRWRIVAGVVVTAGLLVMTAILAAQDPRRPASVGPAFPDAQWETATPESQGLDGPTLAAALAAVPAPANEGPLMVVANGRVVHTIGDVGEPRDLFSCSKAVTAMVLGRLIEQGRITDLEQLVPNAVPGAWGAYPGDATYRMFLTMTSDYGLPAPRSPGARHAYNNHAVDFYGEQMSRTWFGIGPDRMHDVVERALLDVTGWEDAVSFQGQWGGWFGGLRMSCRDLARLGLLLLRDGRWQGERVLSRQLTSGLFRHQIPSTSTAYRSSDPNENSMWNQQAVTDRLGQGWSFGLWRVGPLRTGGSWHAAAMDGYRGKRVLLCPRGTLSNPDLEVMLVCLPNLRDEGPDTAVYLQAIESAVIRPVEHPEHDPRCVTAVFADGTVGPLRVRSGSVQVGGGHARLTVPTQLMLADAPLDDATVVVAIGAGLPANATAGVVLRAATPAADAFAVNGTQTFAGVQSDANGRLRIAVAYPRGGMLQWRRGAFLTRSTAVDRLVLRVDVAGSVVRASVNGEPGLGAQGVSGVPAPPNGGYLGVCSTGHSSPIALDYVLARAADGPIGQVTVDASGAHMLTVLAERGLHDLGTPVFHVDYDDLVIELPFLSQLLPHVWPTLEAAGPDHLVVSSRGATIPLLPDHSLAIQIGPHREAALLR